MYGVSDVYRVFFNDTATTEIYTLSLHDALPICPGRPDLRHRPDHPPDHRPGGVRRVGSGAPRVVAAAAARGRDDRLDRPLRSEEHTSELQSRQYLVCRLLLEKKICTRR